MRLWISLPLSQYYAVTFDYTEKLRKVLIGLRRRLVWVETAVNQSSFFHFTNCRETVESELKTANQQQALGIAILLLVLIISPIIIFLVRLHWRLFKNISGMPLRPSTYSPWLSPQKSRNWCWRNRRWMTFFSSLCLLRSFAAHRPHHPPDCKRYPVEEKDQGHKHGECFNFIQVT